MSRTACLLCGAENQETRLLMVEWLRPVGGQTWTTLPRCVDRPGCRTRVELAGGQWEVRDGTPSIAAPMPPPQPVDEPTAAVAHEAPEANWFGMEVAP